LADRPDREAAMLIEILNASTEIKPEESDPPTFLSIYNGYPNIMYIDEPLDLAMKIILM